MSEIGDPTQVPRFLVWCVKHYTTLHLLLQDRPLFLLIQASAECCYDDNAICSALLGQEEHRQYNTSSVNMLEANSPVELRENRKGKSYYNFSC